MQENLSRLDRMDIPMLARAYRNLELSPVEVTETFLNRIEKAQPEINAFITVTADHARKLAADSEVRFRKGTPLGILDGIPYSVKDIIHVKGFPTTMGCSLYEKSCSQVSAFAVQKLEQSGAVLLGKVNTSQFALGATGEVSSAGPCCNPYDTTRISGGSSSGSAASVGKHLCQFSLGTDTGGSIRAPSALCGVYGMRPTMGRVSAEGILMNCQMMDTIGVISNSVQDNAIVLEAITGFDPAYALSRTAPEENFARALQMPLTGLTLGVPYDFFRDAVDGYMKDAMDAAIERFRQLGVEIRIIPMPDIGRYRSVMSNLLIAEAYGMHEENLKNHSDCYAPELLARFAQGQAVTTGQYVRYARQRHEFRREFIRIFEGVDAVLLPTQATIAVKQNADPNLVLNGTAANLYEISSRFLWFTAFAGTAAISVPCGFHEGLPLGLQLLGADWQEATLYRFAYHYQNTFDSQRSY